MKLGSIYQQVGSWLEGGGPINDIVISSRVRLARNIAGFQFFSHADDQQQQAALEFIREQIGKTPLKGKLTYVLMRDTTPLEKQILSERRLISKELAEGDGARAVAVTRDETLALMINEEDHMRIQVMRSGMQLQEVFDRIIEIDNALEEVIEYAFSPEYGYLTACPTNVGTGMRVSVMLHLPGLKMTSEIERVFRAAKEMHLAVRGLYGEGSEPIGDFFQLSNQTTLGKTEEEIISQLVERAVEPIVEYERRARHKLMEERLTMLDDKIFRAKGLLSNARLISTDETLYMLSYIRLGIHLGRLKDIPLEKVNRLFLLCQPGHLQNLHREKLEAGSRDRVRADFIRQILSD